MAVLAKCVHISPAPFTIDAILHGLPVIALLCDKFPLFFRLIGGRVSKRIKLGKKFSISSAVMGGHLKCRQKKLRLFLRAGHHQN
jgi:hypothetical protein